jgi:aminoglycoside phosphotransferase (APT) family kinase protein
MIIAMSELLASGRTADVFALGPDRVLRRYRNGQAAEGEAEIMRYVGNLGYPVPAVYHVAGSDLVLARIEGGTLVEAMVRGAITLDDGARMLADLHETLHALPPRVSAEPEDRIIHLDLHPENILLGPAGPVVIDWSNAGDGPPDLDVAVSAMIMAEIAADADHEFTELAAAWLSTFLANIGVPPSVMIERAMEMRMRNPSLSAAEKARLPKAAALIQ